MKTVLVFGTFDSLHPGHRWFLRRAAAFGNRLVAAVARDEFVAAWKGQAPSAGQEQRLTALLESALADEAVLSDEQVHSYKILQRIKPDIVCLGHDQHALKEDMESYLKTHGDCNPRIIVLPPWQRRRYSSSRIKNTESPQADSRLRMAILYGLMFLAMAAFGYSWVAGKQVSSFSPPGTLTFIRAFFTMLAYLPLLLVRWTRKDRSEKNWLKGLLWCFAGGLSMACYNILFFFGLNAGLAGKAGLIVTTMNPLFTFAITSAAKRTPLRRLSIVGIILGIIACAILIEPWNRTGTELADPVNLIFIAAALLWSLLTISSRQAQKHLRFSVYAFSLYTFASILLFPLALRESGAAIFSGPPVFWINMLILSVAVGAYGIGLYTYTTTKLGTVRGSAFTYLVPIFIILFTWTILGEVPRIITVSGATLAIFAFMLINVQKKKDSR
ncbi:MAG: hypothetical protein B0D92_07005 [Spirochaeta sp. LUC14_002_19_P3]|nr:MAG: hypothetical protein B0D92_07005 [Spirochaeta sp. LUC14_002_19_P3]